MGLHHIDELNSLFKGIATISRDAWVPSRDGLRTDDMFPPHPPSNQCQIWMLNLNQILLPSSQKDVGTERKRRRKNRSLDEDGDI